MQEQRDIAVQVAASGDPASADALAYSKMPKLAVKTHCAIGNLARSLSGSRSLAPARSLSRSRSLSLSFLLNFGDNQRVPGAQTKALKPTVASASEGSPGPVPSTIILSCASKVPVVSTVWVCTGLQLSNPALAACCVHEVIKATSHCCSCSSVAL